MADSPMHAFLLQDWVTIRGKDQTVSITQGEAAWLDLDGYLDVVSWLEVREMTSDVTLVLQTAVDAENDAFVTMLSPVPNPGVTVSALYQSTAGVALLRWLRWQLTADNKNAPWDLTFRIWIAANAPGRQ